MAVQEWKARKAQRASDPLLRITGATEADGIEARVNGRLVARSTRTVVASGRVYFPLEHCDAQFFELSTKRWT